MAYNNKKNSETPAKFINLLFGGARRRREQRAANEDFEYWMDKWDNQKMENPYAGVKNPYENLQNRYENMENTMEDLTVNLKQAEFQKEQTQQSMANIMAGMQGAAGASGIAGLAQVLANQGVKAAQESAADIGAQEAQNQKLAREMAAQNQRMQLGEQARLDQLDVEGEQKRDLMEREGQRMVDAFEQKKLDQQLEWSMQRKGAADAARDQARAGIDSMIGSVAGSILSDIRLKHNITPTGFSKSGIPTYTFSYIGDDKLWSGTMAQDLLDLGMDNAVVMNPNGYYSVDYSTIDVDMIAKN